MTQYEFVTELESALRGNVDERVIRENVKYYNDYISEQKAAGKSDEEIFAALGSPRLIAKTIIDTSGEQDDQDAGRSGDFDDTESNGGDGWSFRWMKEKVSQNWVTKTIAILAVLAVVFLVLSIVLKIVGILFKPAVVVLAVAAVYYIIKNYSKK